jgi:GT2 family glycosyltransferase
MQKEVENISTGRNALEFDLAPNDDSSVSAPSDGSSEIGGKVPAAPAAGNPTAEPRMPEEPRNAALDARADRVDVQRLYNFFLRRDPENAEIWVARTGLPIAELVADMIGAEEFQRRVRGCLTGRPKGQRDYVFGRPPAELLIWAANSLGLGPQAKSEILLSRTWARIDLTLLRDESIVERFAPNLKAEILLILARQEWSHGSGDREFDIAGFLDIATCDQVEGWCCDCGDLKKRLTVEIYVENDFVGVVESSGFRRDLLETIGADGRFAFSFIIPAMFRSLFSIDRWIVAREASSRRVLGKLLCPRTDVVERSSSLDDMRKELQQIKLATRRIEDALPGVLARRSYSLDDYTQYYPTQYAITNLEASAPTLSESDPNIEFKLTLAVLVDIAEPRCLRDTWASIASQSVGTIDVIFIELNGGDDDYVPHFATQTRAGADSRFSVYARRTRYAKEVLQLLAATPGDYVGFLRVGDRLAPEAAARCAAIAEKRRPKLIYTDEDTIDEDSEHRDPILKPDFDLDFLLTTNYIGNFLVLARTELEERITSYYEAGEADIEAAIFELVVRTALAAGPTKVCHIPRVLYHNRDPNPKMLSTDRRRDILVRCLPTEQVQVSVECSLAGTDLPQPLRLLWRPRAAWPTVSIIIPTRDQVELLSDCLQSVLNARAEYDGDVEILVVDNDSVEPEALSFLAELAAKDLVRVMPYRGRFNWSAINNYAAKTARGEAIIFLNNDTRVLSQGWLEELAGQAMRSDVGAVGALLLYADGTIQHGGTIVGCHGVAAHDGVGAYPASGSYMGRLTAQRSVAAVTGACLATRKSVWETLGGFDEINLQVAFNDTDYCMRARESGLRVIYTPYARAYHFESKTRGLTGESPRERAEARAFRERWGDRIVDPYYNAHFERHAKPFTLLRQLES